MTDGFQEPTAENQREYPCSQCGSLLKFQPGSRSITCQHCGHGNEIEKAGQPVVEHDLRQALARAKEEHQVEETVSVKCESCAAEYSFEANEHAGSCPFCGTDTVADTTSSKQIKPDALLPFAITKQQAAESMQRWLKGLWFAPSKLSRFARGRGDFSGLYLPYWTFDSDTQTSYRGERGTNYYVKVPHTTMVDGKQVRTTRTEVRVRWKAVTGSVSRFFDDVLVPGSHSLPRKALERVGSWDLSSLEGYQKDFLVGFRAESYQVGVDDAFVHAQDIMSSVIYNDIRRDIGGDHQRITKADTKHDDTSFKHVLLPLWLSAFQFKGKSYRLAVNGRTGEVYGERPYSGWKIFFAVAAAFVVAAIVGIVAIAIDKGGF